MVAALSFERPLVELEKRSERSGESKNSKGEDQGDLDAGIERLENRALDQEKESYQYLTPWARARLARHPGRPDAPDYIKMLFTDFLALTKDGNFGDDSDVMGGIGRFDELPVTVIGQVKGHNTKENPARNRLHPESLRKCLRLVQQAAKFHRPVISLIDTPGAYSGIDAEKCGQALAIVNNLYALLQIRTPLITVIIGEANSGGTLALGVGDALLMFENAVFSVISPEEYAAILRKDSTHVQEAAAALKMTASELLSLGLIDGIIPEPLGGAHRDPLKTANNLRQELRQVIQALRRIELDKLITLRWHRLRSIGRAQAMSNKLVARDGK